MCEMWGLHHRSCLERKQKLTSDYPRVECWAEEADVGATLVSRATPLKRKSSKGDIAERLKLENSFPIKSLAQSEEKIRLLEDNVKSLYEYKKLLEEKNLLSLDSEKVVKKPEFHEADHNSVEKSKYRDKVQQKKDVI